MSVNITLGDIIGYIWPQTLGKEGCDKGRDEEE